MKNYDFNLVEPELAKRWRKLNLLKLLEDKNKKGKPYFLLEGPPYANNVPHVGHLRNIYYKDFNMRYAFMTGRSVLLTSGFDTHGLPIENMMEKKLGFKTKKDIFDFGVKKFMKECRKLTDDNIDFWMKLYEKYGCWFAWKDPYLTYKNDYLESGWWTFKTMWDKGQVYEGHKSVHWCPRCETAAAGYEVTDSYATLSDPGIYVKFKLSDEDASFLVFTTTPWTLPANVAIAVSGKDDYVKVQTPEGNLILAEAQLQLLDRLKLKYKVLRKFKGKTLEGRSYEPVLDVPSQQELSKDPKGRKVILSISILKERIAPKVAAKKGLKAGDVYEDFVTVEAGTGLVHTAPGHGKTDNEIGRHYKLPVISPVNDSGKFTDEAGKYEGLAVRESNQTIIDDLKASDKLLHVEKISHSYPVCWRCKTPLIFRISRQWFFRTDHIRKKLLSENEKVNWMPEFARERMADWLVNYEDWNFSRSRFWGIPIPVWKCDDCNENTAVGSKKELEKVTGKKLKDSYDLHNVLELTYKCKCGGTKRKVPEIFDVWFDSGIAPWAWMGAPLKNKKQFEKYFPVDRISEATDQIRGWFFSLLYTSVSAFGKAPYKTISMPAFAVDAKGEKMSKSLGNVVWAMEGIQDLGADLIRFYYTTNVAPYELAKFNVQEVRKETFGVINTLWNLHSYLMSEYSSVPEKVKLTAVEDKWILSRLNSTIDAYHAGFEKFEYHQIGRALSDFILNDLSRTYIQLVRDRIENKDDKVGYALLKCISTLVKLLAPISPFVSDKIYLNLSDYGMKEKSVHLERLPTASKAAMNKDLEREFELVRNVISDVLAIRDKTRRNLRWQMKGITVVSSSRKVTSALKKYKDIVLKQTNSLTLSTKARLEGVKYDLRLDFKRLGKDYGKLVNDISKEFYKQNVEAVMKGLNKSGYMMKVAGKNVKLAADDVIVKVILPSDITGVAKREYVVYADLDETADMKKAGFSREVVRKVQDMRKGLGMKKTDRIHLELDSPEKLDLAYIKSKTNSHQIELVKKLTKKNRDSLDVRGMKFKIALSKA